MHIQLDPKLADRLCAAARQLGRDPADCALSAIRAFVADCEDSQRLKAQLGGGWVAQETLPD